MAGDTQGRALLHCVVKAIQEGRWDDLTGLLQSHAPVLQKARLRLEQQALDRHAAARAAATAARSNKTASVAPADGREESAEAAQDSATVGQPETATGPVWKSFAAIASWADRAPWQALLLVQLFILASYAPGLMYSGFLMDDSVAIERNPNVVSATTSFAEFMRRDYWGLPMHGSGWTNKSFRPLTTWTYRLNYLLHGLQSSGFHITNVLLHCVTSMLVGRTAEHILGLSGTWSAAAAALFGVHPVHTENVLYLVGRADVLSMLFGALALNSYAWLFCPPRQGEGQPCGCWALPLPLALVVASGLCKEIGFTLFAIFLLMELLDFLTAQSMAAAKGSPVPTREWRRTRLRVGLLIASTIVAFIARYRHTGGTSLNMSPQDNPISFETSRFVRVLSYAYLHGVYAKLLCFPRFLCYDYSMDAIPSLQTLLDCRLLLPITTYTAFLAAVSAALSAPRAYRRAGLLSLALLLVTFLPASNILFPVGTVIGERLLYVPSLGFCLAVVLLLHYLTAPPAVAVVHATPSTVQQRPKRGQQRGKQKAEAIASSTGHCSPQLSVAPMRSGALSPSLLAVLLSVLVVLAGRTVMRVRDWESSETLFIRDGHTQPMSSKTQFNLGITHMQRQEWDEAVTALVRCAHADPLSSLPFYRIGQIEILRGRFPSAERWLSAALDKFGASLMVRDEEVFHDLSVALFQNGKIDAAERRLRIALELNPDFAKGWNNLACCLVARNIYDAARASQRAVSLMPENPQYWANLALLARGIGDRETSTAAWQQALQIWPSMPEPRDCTWEFAPGG